MNKEREEEKIMLAIARVVVMIITTETETTTTPTTIKYLLDAISSNVALRHLPKTVTIPTSTYNLLHCDIHKHITTH